MKTLNKYEVNGSVAKVYFNNSSEFFLCDTEDLEKLLSGHTWRKDKDGYAVATIYKRPIAAHQYILGKKDGLEIDHKNRNKLDNRKSNLRHVSRAENARNIDIVHTKMVGIQPSLKGNRYKAFIHCMKKTIYLGTFDTPEEAIRARKDAEIFYWGQQA